MIAHESPRKDPCAIGMATNKEELARLMEVVRISIEMKLFGLGKSILFGIMNRNAATNETATIAVYR